MKLPLAVFVKTPGLSPIKTRLAASVGEQKALEFYRRSLRVTEAVVHAAVKGAVNEAAMKQ
jgi:glycosyltransferase A (GT-A) superfamily protein (DUF2064 family)